MTKTIFGNPTHVHVCVERPAIAKERLGKGEREKNAEAGRSQVVVVIGQFYVELVECDAGRVVKRRMG